MAVDAGRGGRSATAGVRWAGSERTGFVSDTSESATAASAWTTALGATSGWAAPARHTGATGVFNLTLGASRVPSRSHVATAWLPNLLVACVANFAPDFRSSLLLHLIPKVCKVPAVKTCGLKPVGNAPAAEQDRQLFGTQVAPGAAADRSLIATSVPGKPRTFGEAIRSMRHMVTPKVTSNSGISTLSSIFPTSPQATASRLPSDQLSRSD
jgi:hypothetical protein